MENRSKLKILYLYQHLVQNTSSEQPESTKMLSNKYSINVSRDTISDDFTILCAEQFSTENKYYYDGQGYTVSPYVFICDGDYYYLRGFCDERNSCVHFA